MKTLVFKNFKTENDKAVAYNNMFSLVCPKYNYVETMPETDLGLDHADITGNLDIFPP